MTKPRPKGASEPLIAAMLARLPAPGQPWSADERMAWLRMMAGAFDVVYGPQSPIAIGMQARPIAAEELPNPIVPRGTVFAPEARPAPKK